MVQHCLFHCGKPSLQLLFYEDVSHDIYRKIVWFGSNELFLLNLSVNAVFRRCFVQYSIMLISYSIMLSAVVIFLCEHNNKLLNLSLFCYYNYNSSCTYMYRPLRDGWLSWPCWLTDSGRLNHNVVTHPASSLAQDRESFLAETSVILYYEVIHLITMDIFSSVFSSSLFLIVSIILSRNKAIK